MQELRIATTAHTTVEQANGFRIPGYLIVQPRSSATRLVDLSPGERLDLFERLTSAERVVARIVAPERVYLLRFGEADERIHFHVVPRTRALAASYAAETGDRPPYSGAAFVDWLWAHRETLARPEDELVGFVDRARAVLVEDSGPAAVPVRHADGPTS